MPLTGKRGRPTTRYQGNENVRYYKRIKKGANERRRKRNKRIKKGANERRRKRKQKSTRHSNLLIHSYIQFIHLLDLSTR